MQYNIFSKNVKICCSNNQVKQVLTEELDIYPHANGKFDVEVVFVDEIKFKSHKYISPSHHVTFDGGFVANFGAITVLFENKESLYIEIMLPRSKKRSKYISYDFRTVVESIGTIIHELVFVPMTYFFKDLAIVHASAFRNLSTGKTFLIGGTGGVGKTSLELLFCKKSGYSFIADDIAVVNNEGMVFPNLSYPKIYGYNTGDDRKFQDLLLSDDKLLGKLQWHLRKKILGGNKVRRKISPIKIYGELESESVKLSNYITLIKSDCVEEIFKKRNVELEVSDTILQVIRNEYHTFHQHITWHEYNCNIHNLTPIINLKDSFSNMKLVLDKAFANVNSDLLILPNKQKHKEFISTVEGFIE